MTLLDGYSPRKMHPHKRNNVKEMEECLMTFAVFVSLLSLTRASRVDLSAEAVRSLCLDSVNIVRNDDDF